MTDIANSRSAAPSTLLTWTQSAAIFAVCANLFSTALGNLGFVTFLILFLCICGANQRRHLDTANFPVGVAIALGVYLGLQIIGLTYTDASMSYALKTIFADRKIFYIIPLALIFSEEKPKKRFLICFLATAVAGLGLSFLVINAHLHWRFGLNPDSVFRSNVTQSMIFALAGFLSMWFGLQYRSRTLQILLFALAAAFFLNIALLTPGRSGYLVCLVLLVWCFAMWRGLKGVLVGTVVALLVAVVAFNASSSVHDRVMKGVNEISNYSTSKEESSLGIRMVLYKTTWRMILKRPLLGTGTGGFKDSYSRIVAQENSGWQAKPAEDPHNQYLFVTVQNGLIGLFAFLGVLSTIFLCCVKSGSIYGKMAAGCVLAWCATSLFSGHFRTFPEGHLIAFIVGILMVNRSVVHRSEVTAQSAPATT